MVTTLLLCKVLVGSLKDRARGRLAGSWTHVISTLTGRLEWTTLIT